jgi:hypothetical protein
MEEVRSSEGITTENTEGTERKEEGWQTESQDE